MKKTSAFRLVFIMILTIGGCDQEIVDEVIKPDPIKNLPPQAPQIDLFKISHNSATISCDKAFDPDHDKLYYSLYLEDSQIISNTDINFLYKFENLRPLSDYTGIVQVSDLINDPVETAFNFTTSEYITRFSSTYSSFLGNVGGGLSIDFTQDGGYIILGTISTWTHFLYTIKIDSLGYEQWSKIYDIPCTDFDGEIIEVSNGNYVFVVPKHVIMIGPGGEIIWDFQNPQANYCSIFENDKGELVIAGKDSDLIFISRLNLNGEEAWKKVFSESGDKFVNSLSSTHDNNYMIFGTKVKQSGNGNDFWITKININGETLWEKTYENPVNNYAAKIILCKDNGFAMVGNTLEERSISSTRVLKTDESGNLLWEKYFRWDSFKTIGRSIIQNRDESFIFCADNGYSPVETVLVKLDQSGDILWKHHFKPDDNIDYVWGTRDMKLCSDNGVVVTGIKSWIWSEIGKETGLWVFKTDKDGYYSLD